MGPAMRLDHVSVAVPDLAAAVEHLDRTLGLRATVSPAAPERHSRVHLDRSYLEVSVGSSGPGWEATMWFLRFADPEALRAHLDGAGIAYWWGEWAGVDGTWDDVEVHVGEVPLPTLIRRTAPSDVARDWPPALTEPHRCGAVALAEIHLEVPSLGEAEEAYGRLLGGDGPARTQGGVRVPLATGAVVLTEGPSRGIAGVVLSVGSLADTRAELGACLGPEDDGVAWADPERTYGLALGFTQRAVPGGG